MVSTCLSLLWGPNNQCLLRSGSVSGTTSTCREIRNSAITSSVFWSHSRRLHTLSVFWSHSSDSTHCTVSVPGTSIRVLQTWLIKPHNILKGEDCYDLHLLWGNWGPESLYIWEVREVGLNPGKPVPDLTLLITTHTASPCCPFYRWVHSPRREEWLDYVHPGSLSRTTLLLLPSAERTHSTSGNSWKSHVSL